MNDSQLDEEAGRGKVLIVLSQHNGTRGDTLQVVQVYVPIRKALHLSSTNNTNNGGDLPCRQWFSLQHVINELELGRATLAAAPTSSPPQMTAASTSSIDSSRFSRIVVRDGSTFALAAAPNTTTSSRREWKMPRHNDAQIEWWPDVQLQFVNAPLRLTIVEEEADPQSVLVTDSATPQDIRDALSRMIHETLNEADRLSLDDDELEEDVPCSEQDVYDGAELRLVRSSRVRLHQYTCGECGSMVELRQLDIIMCRKCGYNIVYKPRTNKPVMILAR